MKVNEFSTPFKEEGRFTGSSIRIYSFWLDVIWLAIFAIQIINHTKSLPKMR